MLTRKKVQILHRCRAVVSSVKSVPKTGINVAGCFYDDRSRDFNGNNGAGRNNRTAATGMNRRGKPE